MLYEITPLTPEEAETIEQKIDERDRSVVPPVRDTNEELVYKITDGEGNIIAGCTAYIDRWNCMDLGLLWVDERYRNRGLGSALFRRILQTAREKGCPVATVGLFSFQASAFCEKHGMTVFDTKENCPKGHAHYYLFIRPDRVSAGSAPSKPLFPIECGDADDDAYLLDRFYAYSYEQAPPKHEYLPFDRKIADAAGKLIAGAEAGVNGWDVGYALSLWVEEPYRGQGMGSKLLREAEREIKAHGGTRVLVSAFDWQAGFFEKNGYAITGACEDFPKAHRLCMMEKRL